MAKNHIITRSGINLNLNTGKGFKTENLYIGGSDLTRQTYPNNFARRMGKDSLAYNPIPEEQPTNRLNADTILGKVAGVLPAVGTAVGAYGTLSGADTSKYDTTLNTVPKSISIGNYDALADWQASLPVLNDPTASDLDTMSTAGKIGTGLSTIGSLAASGSQVGGWVGGLVGAGIGAGVVGAGLFGGKNKRERLAEEIAMRNSLANQRLNSMYLHELGDIQEEQANQAYANLSAKGGKIHIAPSKRGTFKAQASRMGMSVQEAARHILANKNRYSPAMRKKAAFAKAAAGWKHEDGGDLDLFEFPVEYNHGGYFSLQPELIKINQGGTHEQNPLDGVPMGFDENGIPNLVEEGETIFDDYVFSNRLAPTEKQLAEGGLATKYKDHTFADISEKIAKQFEETPVDPIARDSFKESMQRLKTIQEQVREENAVPEAQQMPEQSIAPEGMESVGQATMEDQMSMEQMPEEVPQEVPQDMMEQVPIQPEMMQAYGGNLFATGGDLGDEDDVISESNKYSYYNYSPGQRINRFIVISEDRTPVIDNKEIARIAKDRALREGVKEGTPGFDQLYKQKLSELTERVKRNAADIVRENKKSEDAYNNARAKQYLTEQGYPNLSIKDKDLLGKVDEDTAKGLQDILGSKLSVTSSVETPSFEDEPMGPSVDETIGPPKPTNLQGRKTDGVAGQTVNAKTGAGNSSARANTALYKEGTTAEQKRELWYNSSGKALTDNLRAAAKSWKDQGLTGDALTSERRKYAEALNAVQQAYAKAYEAGYDPTTRTSNKDAAVQALQELWEKNSGNKYFNDLVKAMNTQGNSGDNSARGWVDGLWGDITRNRNWGLSEYFSDANKNVGDYYPELAQAIKEAGFTYTPTTPYGDDGYKAYTFGLQSDRQSMGDTMQEIKTPAGSPLSPFKEQPNELAIQRPEVALTPEQERIQRRAQRQEARQERREAREAQGLPTWMRYAPIAGSAISAIWDMAQKPDYSVAEAAERIASNTPRARFNPIGNYLTYRPVDRNFYLNQVRNQGLATDRGILNASGANQGAAAASLLASQYNTQNAIGNSLMQQELANRQNEQQVAQFNRGTDQYNSQGLFNESVYNQRAGMHSGQYALTAAQLRQAERQRRNAAISADLTNLFQGIGDIGWENMNANMVNMNPALQYQINLRGNRNAGETTYKAKCGGMLTKKKSRRK